MTSVVKIEELVEKDPAITAKVLSTANSPLFRSSTRITSIGGAIFRIGFNNVSSIALGIALLSVFESKKQQDLPLDSSRIFKHSIAVGMLAKSLSKKVKLDNYDEIFSCGILHDLGLTVLNTHFPDLYQGVIEEIRTGVPLLQAEKQVLGVTHAEVGTWLAENWNLPESIIECIADHHTLTSSGSREVALIHITDYIISKSFFSVIDKSPVYPLLPEALLRLDLSEDDLAEMERDIDPGMFSEGVLSLY
jgi:putative nucleotidyltransferase with HDIG domain